MNRLSSFQFSRRFASLQLPVLMLITLLQRTPVLRLLAGAESAWVSSSLGQVLKATAVVATMLGAVDTVAGATTLVTDPVSPAEATVGVPLAPGFAFAYTGGATTVGSYSITNLPPGLSVPGSILLGGIRTLNNPFGTITGTPTQAGNFVVTITAFDDTNLGAGTHGSVQSFYTIVVESGVTPIAPAITTQPANLTVTAGQQASFSVVATGTPTPTFQWQKNNVNISGATNATFTITSTVSGDAATYRVIVTNSAGNVTSNGATLTVNPVTASPAITSQPANQSVTAGQPASFSVSATGTPTPTFQWQKNNVNIGGATSSTFTIASTVSGDAATYTVVVSNSSGTVTSNGATLTVNPAPIAPAITTQPANLSVTVGQPASFSVSATGTPTPTFQWQKNNVNIGGATSSTFTIATTVSGDTATYRVIVTNSAGSATSNGATLTVSAQLIAPVITTQPVSQTVNGGGSVTFTAAASGSPTPTYQWKNNNVAITGATSATYTIASTAAADAGSYTVVATNSAGAVTSNVATLTLTIPSGFDVAGYYARNLDIAAFFGSDSLGAWLHFYNYGLAEGRQFDSQFIVDEYLQLNADLKNAFGADRQAALLHWLIYGHPLEDRIGRVPIGFNVDSYLARYPDLFTAFGAITPTAVRNVTVWYHYLDYGVQEGRSDGDFEAFNYLATNGDLAGIFGTDVEAAALHWYFYGRREGRRIPSNFDVVGYRARNPDIPVVWGNDLYGSWLHFRDVGVSEGRVYDDLFRVLEYRARYSDVQTSYGNDLTGVLLHWLFYGKPEGRLGRNP